MRITAILVGVGLAAIGATLNAQQQPQAAPPRRTSGPVTLVIMVTDQAGAPLTNARVTVQGPVSRDARTEQGRMVFEGLPSGTYKLTFDLEGFVKAEKDVTAKGSAPIDVKMALTPVPEPPPPPKPAPPPLKPVAPVVDAEPVLIDVPSFIEKNFIGRAAGKTSPLACASGGEATLLQIREPVAEHTHQDADEYLYVIAGEGAARAGKIQESLHAGVFMLVPRGVPHVLTATGRSPLVVISIKAGEHCSPPVG
jgi:mannose-6-phosphate isomerase-like protein (cupin superfamily)